MSLEDALNKNTAAVEQHNALLTQMLKAGGKAAPAPAAADKPAAKPAAKPATAAKTTKEPTMESLTAAATAFLKTGDKAVRTERAAQIGLINEHFGSERFTTIAAENWGEALGYLKDFEAGRTPSFIDENGGEGDDGDGDEEDSLV